MKRILAVFLVIAMVFAFVGCGKGDSDKTVLNVLNWDDYIDPDLISEFEKRNPDIKVNMTPLTSNEEMLTALSQSDSIYDVCFPSDYAIENLLQNNLLLEIDKSKITNFDNIMESSLDLEFDKGNKYSVPYMWGTVGILYNTKMVDEEVDSWDILWNEKYAGNIIMYDSVRDAMAVATKKLGYSLNTKNEEEINAAGDALIEQKKLNQNYGTDEIKQKMIANSAALAVVYSGDAVYAMDENEDLAYVVPKEGSNKWYDNMVILKRSKNVEAAYKFIDFLCDAEVAKQNTEYIGFTTANQKGFDMLDEEIKNDYAYMPPQDVLDKCEVFVDLGEKIKLYDAIWTRLKAN